MCGFDGGAVSVGVGLMVVLLAWVWLSLYFGEFCGVFSGGFDFAYGGFVSPA